MAKQTSSPSRTRFFRLAVGVVLLAAAGYLLTRHWPTVRAGFTAAKQARLGWMVAALLLMSLTFCLAAIVYDTLAFHRLRWRQTVLVELAAAFVNRLLPSGLGGLGLHGLYLYRRRHSLAEATVVVSINNLVGIAGHLLLLGAVLVWRPAALGRLASHYHLGSAWLFVGVLAAIGLALAMPAVHGRLQRFGRNLFASLRRVDGLSLLRALGWALLLTITYTATLLSCVRSVGVNLSAYQIFIVFSLGMLAGTVTPTPGGLVGTEAGLYAGFVSYGVAPPQAAAIVLLYRLVTYWLPLVPGLLALLLARRRQLV